MTRRARGFTCLALLLASAACATTPRRTEAPVFFPPAPGLPRIQYLTSFRGLKDIEEQSSFDKFVVGEQQDLRIDKPYGIGIHDGKMYVCDTNATVIVFDLVARSYSGLRGATGAGKLIQPINISIEADGTKFVADPARGQIVVFDRNDDYVRAYGTPGNWRPVDAVPFEDRIYVADPANGLVKVFDRESGEQVKTIGDRGEPEERLDRPTNLAFDGEGYLYVTDVGRFQVLKFDRDGHFKAAIGRPGDNLGHFARPKGIAVDRDGRLYAVDASFNNVQIFGKEGRLLMFFGEGGDVPGGFLLPAKVTIDYDNVKYFAKYLAPQFQPEYLLLVTNQFGDHPVSILAFGQEKGKHYPTEEELLRQIEEKRRLEREKEQAEEQEPPPTP